MDFLSGLRSMHFDIKISVCKIHDFSMTMPLSNKFHVYSRPGKQKPFSWLFQAVGTLKLVIHLSHKILLSNTSWMYWFHHILHPLYVELYSLPFAPIHKIGEDDTTNLITFHLLISNLLIDNIVKMWQTF